MNNGTNPINMPRGRYISGLGMEAREITKPRRNKRKYILVFLI
jgi:hypothetical protein